MRRHPAHSENSRGHVQLRKDSTAPNRKIGNNPNRKFTVKIPSVRSLDSQGSSASNGSDSGSSLQRMLPARTEFSQLHSSSGSSELHRISGSSDLHSSSGSSELRRSSGSSDLHSSSGSSELRRSFGSSELHRSSGSSELQQKFWI